MKIVLHETAPVPFYKRISYLYLPALFVVISLLLEVTMFALMRIPFPKFYIFSLSMILFIAAGVALLRNKWVQMVICTLLLGFQVTTTIANVIANYTCMEIFSLETLKTLTTAFNTAGAVELVYWFLVPIIALIVIYIVAVFLIIWFCRTPKVKLQRHRWQPMLAGALAFVSFFSYTVAYSGLPNYKTGADAYVANLSNEKFLYDTFSNRVSSLRSFGSYSYYFDNFLKLIGGKTTTMMDTMDLTIKDFQANEFTLDSDEVLGEGDNLIMVLMETFERAAINPITMPNLYQFMQESCVEIDGYYSIERTCFTDHIGQTGMHVAGKEYWNNFGNVAVPHSLANIFNRSAGDYVTAAFHDYRGSFYNRENIFTKNLGFQNFYDFNTYATEQYDAHCGLNSDKDLFEQNLTKIAPADQNFYSYIVSVSTHSISASKYNLGEYYPEFFAYLEQPENWETLTQIYPVLLSDDAHQVLTAKNYLAGTYSFDQGFGALIDHLKTTLSEKNGRPLIENTAIVMFGDHYYYANPQALKPESDNPSNLVGNRCPFIVYNPRAKVPDGTITQAENATTDHPAKCGTTKRRFTSTMDIYPTVCSLFGIQTDQQLTYGHSVFDANNSIGVGYLGGFTWGALGYEDNLDKKPYTFRGETYYADDKVNWQIWRTLDFMEFKGETLTAEQIESVTPLVNRTYASIFLDTALYESNGFKRLVKSKAYQLPAA